MDINQLSKYKIKRNRNFIKKEKKLYMQYLNCLYGAGSFILETGNIAPAGIEINYTGYLNITSIPEGYIKAVGLNKIILFRMSKINNYNEVLFTYDGNPKFTQVMAVMFSGQTLQTYALNNQKQTWNTLGAPIANVNLDNQNQEEIEETNSSLMKNMGSKFKDMKQKDTVGLKPRKSK